MGVVSKYNRKYLTLITSQQYICIIFVLFFPRFLFGTFLWRPAKNNVDCATTALMSAVKRLQQRGEEKKITHTSPALSGKGACATAATLPEGIPQSSFSFVQIAKNIYFWSIFEPCSLLCGRVVELVLARASEAGLDAGVPPQPLDDAGELRRHEALLGGPGQHKELPRVVLQRGMENGKEVKRSVGTSNKRPGGQ